jgi:dUTPase
MHLKLYINDNNNDNNDNNELKQKYIEAALNHNNKILNPNNPYFDAGFDLFNPTRKVFYEIHTDTVNKFDHNIICSAKMVTDSNKVYNTGYYMHPRSSIYKTPLRLANSTGIIDAGYRGNLIGMFDCFAPQHVLNPHDRILQICAPSLMPIFVEIVETIEGLGDETMRGGGGFGSTGN